MVRSPTAPARTDHGFALVAVLVLAGLMAVFAATYASHVIVQERSALASPSTIDVRENATSAVAFARQALASDRPVPASLAGSGAGNMTLSVSDLGSGQRSIEVAATLSDGTGSRKLARTSLLPQGQSAPSGPDALPRLDAPTVAALLDDTSIPKTYVSGTLTLSDTEVDGLLVIQDGATLTLSEVVLTGAIVSADTLGTEAYGAFDDQPLPTLVIAGDVRIDPAPWLPGVAILMPDGVIDTTAVAPRMQLGGDVVAHDVELTGPGFAGGHVQSVSPAVLDAGFELVGQHRRSIDWASGLSLNGSFASEYLAFVPHTATLAEVAAIVGYWSSP